MGERIYIGESFLDRLAKDNYGVESVYKLNDALKKELDAYMKTDDFKTKSNTFRAAERARWEGFVDHSLGKNTNKSKSYISLSEVNPGYKYLIPKLTTNTTSATSTKGTTNTKGTGTTSVTSGTDVHNNASITTTTPIVTTPILQDKFNFIDFTNNNIVQDEDTKDGMKYVRIDPAGTGDFWVREDGKIFIRPIGGGIGLEIISRPNWGGEAYDALVSHLKKYYKQGGTMNRINYFQQGGSAQQLGAQDIRQQIVALVQAAIQGDEKANQTVNQIMEAAKQGDQQAVQLAQMIQAVVQQMKGQATSAKWGSKLSYIRSLKYALGGKACPACEKGAPIKVEEKACGGKAKKAKKRYFGGWL